MKLLICSAGNNTELDEEELLRRAIAMSLKEKEEEIKGELPKTAACQKRITFNFSAEATNSSLGEDPNEGRSGREANAYIAAYVRGSKRDIMQQDEKSSRREANNYIAAFMRGRGQYMA